MKKLLILLFLFPFALAAQKVNGVYTRAEVTAQRPLQCSACLVQEGDSVWLFVRNNASTAVAGPDVIVTTFGSIRLLKTKLAGAINFANANYYTKAQMTPLLDAKVGIGSIGSNQLAYYDGSNKSIYGSNVYQANGKIGINTPNPTEQLHVNGNVRFRSIKSWSRMDIEGHQIDGDVADRNLAGITFGHWGGTSAGGGSVGDWNYYDPYIDLQGIKGVGLTIGRGSNQRRVLLADTLQQVKITSGKTGIAQALTIQNDSTLATAGRGSELKFTATGDTTLASIQVVTQTTNNKVGLMKFLTNNGTSNAARLTINQSGDVGIGTEAPTEKLTLIGALLLTGNGSQEAIKLAGPMSIRELSSTGGGIYFDANSAGGSGGFFSFRSSSSYDTRLIIDANGRVGIGTASPATGALLDLTSTTQLFLPPRMTTTQAGAISTKPTGGMYYDTTLNKMRFWNGSAYETITSAP